MTRANGRAPTARTIKDLRTAQAALSAAQASVEQDPTVTLATTIVNGIVQGVVGGLAQVLQATPLRQHRMCAPCFVALREWENAHKPQIAEAGRAMLAAVEENPEASQNPADYLSEQLRAQIPAVQYAVTAVGGTEVCELHVVAGQQAGQKPGLLVASPGLDVRQFAAGHGQAR